MMMQKQSQKVGKAIAWILSILAFAFLISLFLMKDNLNNYLSKNIKLQSGSEIAMSMEQLVDSLYNYSINESTYHITFLEFGAKACVACRKMEFVLEEVEEEYPETVKVVILNILNPENQDLMKYYGVSAIPTQILLDGNGIEYFRHTGYISLPDLRKHFSVNTK